jgi:hypothetical protein
MRDNCIEVLAGKDLFAIFPNLAVCCVNVLPLRHKLLKIIVDRIRACVAPLLLAK